VKLNNISNICLETPFTQPDWPYLHVIFLVFLFGIFGLGLLFGEMLFLAKSLSSQVVLNLSWFVAPFPLQPAYN